MRLLPSQSGLAQEREMEVVVDAVAVMVLGLTEDGGEVTALAALNSRSKSMAESEADSEAATLQQNAHVREDSSRTQGSIVTQTRSRFEHLPLPSNCLGVAVRYC
jgi:hypothetical protein